MVIATSTRRRWRRYSASMRSASAIGAAADPAANAASGDLTSRLVRCARPVETEFPFCVNLEHSFHFVQTARKSDAQSRMAAGPGSGPDRLLRLIYRAGA